MAGYVPLVGYTQLFATAGVTSKNKQWTLTTLREKLIKIGAKVIRQARSLTFQLAEVAVPRKLLETI